MGILDNYMTGFSNAVLGADPAQAASVYQKLQDQLSGKYSQAKAAFEADPNNKGKQYQAPDPLQRWSDQVNGMITSGDPTLQKAGLEQLSLYQQRATAPESAAKLPAAVQEYQYAVGQGYKGSFQDWQIAQKAAGRSTVNVSVNQNDKPMSVSDAKDLVLPNGGTPLGMTVNQALQAGATFKQDSNQTTQGTSVDTVGAAVADLEKATNGGIPDAVTGTALQYRTMPGVVGTAVNYTLNRAGVPVTDNDAKLVSASRTLASNLTKMMSGAGASDEEYQRVMAQVPAPGQSPEVFRQNLEQTKRNLQFYTMRARNAGVPVKEYTPTPTAKPKVNNRLPANIQKQIDQGANAVGTAVKNFATKSGIQYTVE